MNIRFKRLDHWWRLALLLWLVPVAGLLPLGALWLHQQGLLWLWSTALIVFSASGYAVQFWLKQREQRLLQIAHAPPDPDWPPNAEAAWSIVNDLADQLDPADWPLGDGQSLMALAKLTLERVARHFHPEVKQPLLELTLPHSLLIIERACRDLRDTLTEQVPFSHQLTLGTLTRLYRWKPFAERLFGLYRTGQWAINPGQAVISELWKHLRERGYALAQQDLSRWLLQAFVRQVGRHAIALYSGRLLLLEYVPVQQTTPESARDLTVAKTIQDAAEPLRILVLGRANAGKSSLINALFGQIQAATDLIPKTTQRLMPYRLERDGLEQALIFDTPDAEHLAPNTLRDAAAKADMIFWVSAAHRPDRQSERQILDALRLVQNTRLERHPPPLLVVVTHIDRLRPLREWQPPYDLTATENLKAMSIQAAITALATDLDVPIASVIPVCLADGQVYNVEDTLWVALLNHLDQARRTRLLRCQDDRRRNENWTLLRRQLANAGRFLLALPGRFD